MIEKTNQNWQPTIDTYFNCSLMKVQIQHSGAKKVLQQMVLQLDMQNHQSHHITCTFGKTFLRVEEKYNVKIQRHKTPRG